MTRPDPGIGRSVTVGVSVLGQVVVVDLAGEIDIATRAAVARPIFACVEEGPPGLVIDLTRIAFIGSAGFEILKDAAARARRTATELRIVASTPAVLRPLKASGLLHILPVCRSMPEALSSLSAGLGNAPTP